MKGRINSEENRRRAKRKEKGGKEKGERRRTEKVRREKEVRGEVREIVGQCARRGKRKEEEESGGKRKWCVCKMRGEDEQKQRGCWEELRLCRRSRCC